MTKKDIGLTGENISAKYLERRGYGIFARNFNTKYGELDIVAVKEGKFCFVEVKTASSQKALSGLIERVNSQKVSKICKAIDIFLEKNNSLGASWDFAICAVNLDMETRVGRVNMLINPTL